MYKDIDDSLNFVNEPFFVQGRQIEGALYMNIFMYKDRDDSLNFVHEPFFEQGRQIEGTLYMNIFMYKDIDDSWNFVYMNPSMYINLSLSKSM